MLAAISQYVYQAYVQSLRSKAQNGNPRKWRRFRRWLLKFNDPEIVVPLDSFEFKTLFSSDILLYHFELPFYDCTLPRVAKAIQAGGKDLVMVDIGANVGAATYLVSRQGPGRFLCVEASSRFKGSLAHNLAQIPGSTARFLGLTDQTQTVRVRHDYNEGNSVIHSDPGGESLQFTTLDELLAGESAYGTPNLVKIDTEGFEVKILRGAKGVLAKHHPVVFFEFFPDLIRKQGESPDAMFDLLTAHGYEHYVFYDSTGHLLTSVQSQNLDQLRSLRRYCELCHNFFDVVAFSKADAELHRSFCASEVQLFERSLGRN